MNGPMSKDYLQQLTWFWRNEAGDTADLCIPGGISPLSGQSKVITEERGRIKQGRCGSYCWSKISEAEKTKLYLCSYTFTSCF